MGEGKPLLPEGSPFELWDVRLASGDIKLSIDELDAAFEMGRVDLKTLVRRRGMVKWTTLGEAASLDAIEVQDEPQPPLATVGAAPATPRPPIPRPTPRTLPPPLPERAALLVAAPAPPPPTIEPFVEAARPPSFSSLPPPMTFSAPPTQDADATVAVRRPRASRSGLFVASFFAALIGGATAAVLTIPSVNHRVTELASGARAATTPAITTPAVAPPPPLATTVLPPIAPPAAASSAPAPPPVVSSAPKPKRPTAPKSAPPSHRR